MGGNIDVCEKVQKGSNEMKTTMENFGMPTSCPVDKVTFCIYRNFN